MPALHVGFIDIEATSENEAGQLALEKHYSEIEWDYDGGDRHAIEVLDVDCENPPDGILVEQGYSRSAASIDCLFEEEGDKI